MGKARSLSMFCTHAADLSRRLLDFLANFNALDAAVRDMPCFLAIVDGKMIIAHLNFLTNMVFPVGGLSASHGLESIGGQVQGVQLSQPPQAHRT